MPRASGTYSLPAGNPVVSGTVISSTVQNNTMNDIANELTNSIPRDGSAPPSGNIPMGNFKITGIGAATLATDVAQYQQIQSGTTNYLTAVSGTNTIVATLATPTLASYVTGQHYTFTAIGTNTGATTININALSAKNVQKNAAALVAGDITAGQTYELIYDGTNMQLFGSTTTGVTSTQLQNQTYTSFTTGGTSAAFTLTPSPALTAYVAGKTRFNVTLNAAPTGSPTMAVSGLAAINAKYYDSTGTKQFITAAVTPINWASDVIYDGTDLIWLNILPVAAKLASLPTLTVTQAANAATITLGAFSADFRNPSPTSGTPIPRTLASNASLVIPSGATQGVPTVGTVSSITAAGTTVTLNAAPSVPIQIGDVFAGTNIATNTTVVSFGTYVGGVGTGTIVLSASVTTTATAATFTKPSRVLILAIDNAGTIEVAVVNQAGGNNLDETGLISTTAISAGATANNVVYSTTARTNVAYKVVGFMDFANPTAGQYSVPNLLVASASGRELAAMWSIGIGQTDQNVLAQRVSGQTYYNTIGRPYLLYLNITISGGSFNLSVNGISYGTNNSAGGTFILSVIIPAGGFYVLTLTTATATVWIEKK